MSKPRFYVAETSGYRIRAAVSENRGGPALPGVTVMVLDRARCHTVCWERQSDDRMCGRTGIRGGHLSRAVKLKLLRAAARAEVARLEEAR